MLQKKYSIRGRESLLSPIFKSTFTMSGGPDLAYKFWGNDMTLIGNHIVNQPCIRHWDIDLVGDNKHLSFFNMFVASSIGGYSRDEIATHFHEFFTKILGLDSTRIYASYFGGGNIKGTVFESDEEMRDIWLSLGIPKEKIIELNGKYASEAFVANQVEPVGGPRAELFYDMRKTPSKIKTAEEFLELDKKGLLMEFCTTVLYCYSVIAKQEPQIFEFKKMNTFATAIGFGPQRIMTIAEETPDVKNISVIKTITKHLGKNSSKIEAQIIADHIRGIIFLINDGAMNMHWKGNHGRKTLFKKYVKHLKSKMNQLKLEITDQPMIEMIEETISMFSNIFPEFSKNRTNLRTKFLEACQKV